MANQGKPLTGKLEETVELELGLELFLTGFFDLDTERSHAMGVTPIPLSAIAAYCAREGFDEELTADFTFLVRRLDANQCKEVAKQQKAKS